MDKNEHTLVLDALKPLEPERKCYRLVGGVLVERTASEVRPAVEKNIEGMDEILKQLNVALQAKEKAMAEHVSQYNIKVRGSQDIKDQKTIEADAASKAQTGLLA
mmetsp:Transcript_132000/g.228777  ORF Transcript_132000/g.228777 Transcript_132000/m.228777 type:complete len:105 (-) Transcript_132000:211-525(-)